MLKTVGIGRVLRELHGNVIKHCKLQTSWLNLGNFSRLLIDIDDKHQSWLNLGNFSRLVIDIDDKHQSKKMQECNPKPIEHLVHVEKKKRNVFKIRAEFGRYSYSF
jgi:hypothetical protein